ncbi:MAG: plasmid pRiA4b ORF-3 family protein [Deltaproteobacteria bacterium]|nr:plasmid pRiA4b ORF-3 family protein [Deltaproteobacteria bacterium]
MKPPKQKTMDLTQVYQIKVTLKGSRPPIWRRLQVPGDITLAKLHRILQVAMGWFDSHLHQFKIGRAYYGIPDKELFSNFFSDTKDEKRFKLQQLPLREKSKFVYEYDFGDSWEHEILVEKILPREEGQHYPCCLKGKGACPPEDVGGIWGYADLLEALSDPQHPDREDMLEWVGGEFDPGAFDLDEVNRNFKRIR